MIQKWEDELWYSGEEEHYGVPMSFCLPVRYELRRAWRPFGSQKLSQAANWQRIELESGRREDSVSTV
jgi:hypothetical protein